MHFIRYIGLFLWIPLVAQVSQEGRFSSDYVRGCAPLTVNITEIYDFGEKITQYFYENPNIGSTLLTHTYIQPGVYKIVQLPADDDVVPKTDTLTIEVFEPTSLKYTYLYCDNRQVQVQIDDPTYDSYEVEFAGSATVSILDGQTTTYTFGLVDPLSIKVKGIYTGAPDNCAENTLILPAVKNDLIPPSPTQAQITQPCENVYQLDVQASFEQDVIYEIEWSKSGGAYSSLFEGLIDSEMTFENVPFSSAETSYCIRINARNVCDNTRILGLNTCTTLEPGQLDPVRNLYSTYSGESIVIVLEHTDFGQFIFQRSYNQMNYSLINEGQSSYTDASPFFGRQYFYRISFEDLCDIRWDTQETNPPFVRAEALTTNTYHITFDPAVHTSDHSFAYTGQLIGPEGTQTFPITSNTFELALPVTLGENQSFVIEGTSGDVTIYSNPLKLRFEFIVYVPKAFTPDGDGLNDKLEFFGLGTAQAELKIYNRWGQQIYDEFSSAPTWDGRINGRLADEGVYIYEISVPSQPNHVQKGTFALIKK